MSQGRPDSFVRAAGRHPGDGFPDVSTTPPALSSGRRHHGRHATERGDGFGGVLWWTVAGALVPGAGLLAAGRRRVGLAVLAAVLVALAGGLVLVLRGDPLQTAARVLASPDALLRVALGLALLTLLWAAVVVLTHVALRGAVLLSRAQQVLAGVLVGSLVLAGLLPAVAVANSVLLARDTVASVFGGGADEESAGRRPGTAADPWAGVSRVNLLLIGSDAGKGREGVRPDTLVVASIDPASGNTTLFSLPRNLQRVPFPPGSRAARAFPNGFHCINPQNGVNTDCLLNGVWSWAENNRAQYYPGVKQPGLTATQQAVEQVLGLEIDDYLMVNLKGFITFVDAIGGVRVDVTEWLPIGGSVEDPVPRYGWIEPGRDRRLDGWHALWFARSRWSTNDFDRMRRQRCVLAAVARQADPRAIALNFDRIARAAKDNITTDIPVRDLDAWVTLALRVKQARVTSLPFTDALINTVDPDIPKVHRIVRSALRTARTATPTPSSTEGGRPPAPAPSARPAQPVDVDQVC